MFSDKNVALHMFHTSIWLGLNWCLCICRTYADRINSAPGLKCGYSFPNIVGWVVDVDVDFKNLFVIAISDLKVVVSNLRPSQDFSSDSINWNHFLTFWRVFLPMVLFLPRRKYSIASEYIVNKVRCTSKGSEIRRSPWNRSFSKSKEWSSNSPMHILMKHFCHLSIRLSDWILRSPFLLCVVLWSLSQTSTNSWVATPDRKSAVSGFKIKISSIFLHINKIMRPRSWSRWMGALEWYSSIWGVLVHSLVNMVLGLWKIISKFSIRQEVNGIINQPLCFFAKKIIIQIFLIEQYSARS